MPFELLDSSGNAALTVLASTIAPADTSFSILDPSGWPTGGAAGDFFLEIEDEVIRCSSRSGPNIVVATNGRGWDDTLATTHNSGMPVEHVFTRYESMEANAAAHGTLGQVSGAGVQLIGSGLHALAPLALGAAGLVQQSNGTTVVFSTVGTTGIAADAVTNDKIAPDAITTLEILDANVTTPKIADASVTPAKLDATVAGFGLSGGAGTALSVNVDNNSTALSGDNVIVKPLGINTAEIAALAVTEPKLAADSVITSKILDANVTKDKLAAQSVDLTKLDQSETLSTYVPVWTQGVTITKTVNHASYFRIGPMVYVWAMCTASSNGTTGAQMLFTLPINCHADVGTGTAVAGTCRFSDGTSVTLPGVCTISTTQVAFDFGSQSAVGGVQQSTFQINANHSISMHISYPAA